MRIGRSAKLAMRIVSLVLPAVLGSSIAVAAPSPTSPEPGAIERAAGITNHRVSRPMPVRQVGPLAPAPEPIASAIPTGIKLNYHGGKVISHVQVVLVGWGTIPTYLKTTAPGYFQTLVNSRFMDWHGEYDTAGVKPTDFGTSGMGTSQRIGRGTVVATPIQITPKTSGATGKTVDDTAVAAEIAAQIDAGVLPQPKVEADGSVDTIYFTFFPSTITITQGGASSCSYFCGYHGTFVNKTGKSIYYAVIPDMTTGACSSGCGGNSDQSYGATDSHELSEAITDAEIGIATSSKRPMAWYDDGNACKDDKGQATDCGENGDVCASVLSSTAQIDTSLGIPVQKIWSQRLYNCIAQDPSLPICDGTVHPCNGCASNSDCKAGATCDTTPGSATSGQCVGSAKCTSNADCTTPGKNICDTTAGTCRGCAKDAECSGATPKCDVAAATCVACLTGADCGGTTPVCNTTTKTCKGCSASTDCTAPQVCDPGTGACVGCGTNADCKTAGAPVCDTASRTCVAAGAKDAGADTGTGTGTGNGNGTIGNGNGGNGSVDGGTGGGGDLFDSPAPASGCSTSGGTKGSGAALAGIVLGLAALVRRRSRA